jgi:DNA-directed RNA polymerase specialized sigma24 family protein
MPLAVASATVSDLAELERCLRGGEEAADDITSETFLIGFRSRSRYDLGRLSARPWLYGIAAHLIGKHRRSEVRATGTDPVAESWTESADNRLSAQAAQAPPAAAPAALSPGDRHVLLLIAWADLSYQEVADALGLPERAHLIGPAPSHHVRDGGFPRRSRRNSPQAARGAGVPRKRCPMTVKPHLTSGGGCLRLGR